LKSVELKGNKETKASLGLRKINSKKEPDIPDIETLLVDAKVKQNEIEKISPKKKKVVPSDDPKLKRP
jgi:hypothetical protein